MTPITTKQNLRNAYPLGNLRCDPELVVSYHESSGTTGQPTSTAFTRNDWQHIVDRFLQSGIALTARDWVLVKTPYSMVTTAHQMERAAQFIGATIVPADNRSSNMPYSRVLQLLRELPITIAWCLPSEACLWLRLAQHLGLSPKQAFPNLRALWLAGEPLSHSKRVFLENALGDIKIFRDYGSTETGSLAGDCKQGTMHLWSNHFSYAVKTKNGLRYNGDGELLVTLDREAMPLLNYNTEDRVSVRANQCDCGSSLPELTVHGRSMEQFSVSKIEDRLFSSIESPTIPFWRCRLTKDVVTIEIDQPFSASLVESMTTLFQRQVHMLHKPELVCWENYLKNSRPFLKPKYLFGPNEDWSQAFTYQGVSYDPR